MGVGVPCGEWQRSVDVHHLSWDGTDHAIDNLGTFCSSHHRRILAGTLIVEGKPSTGLRFMHADGTPYGSRRVEPKQVSVSVEAFEGIKSLGFRARDARRAVDQVLREQDWATPVGASDALQEVMHRALGLLQPC